MRRLLLLPLMLPAALAAQRPVSASPVAKRTMPSEASVPSAMREIREADLKRDLYAMAAPAMRGREGGTNDELRASMWVADQYKKIGLAPAGDDGTWFQWFIITRTRVSVPASRVTIGGQTKGLYGDVIPLATVPTEARGSVLWLADAADTTTDVKGRIVATMLKAPAPGTGHRAPVELSNPDAIRDGCDSVDGGCTQPTRRSGDFARGECAGGQLL